MSREINVVLKRTHFAENYTLGVLKVDGVVIGRTLEYPWRDNTPWNDKLSKKVNLLRVSGIREGVYRGELVGKCNKAGEAEWRLQLSGKHGRTAIQFHAGNTLDDSRGCVLVGTSISHTGGDATIANSRLAMQRFIAAIFGDVSGSQGPSDWVALMQSLRVTVRIVGMPAGAWRVE